MSGLRAPYTFTISILYSMSLSTKHRWNLRFKAEILLKKLNSSTSPTGTAQIAAQLLNIMRELKADRAAGVDPLVESFRR